MFKLETRIYLSFHLLSHFCCAAAAKHLTGILKIRFVECFKEKEIREESKIHGTGLGLSPAIRDR